jgi:hypothetical protein
VGSPASDPIAMALRVIAAVRAGELPAPEDCMAMATALSKAADDDDRQPFEHHLRLFGNWRVKVRAARRVAVCAGLEKHDGETAYAAAKRIARKMKIDRHLGVRNDLLDANGGMVLSPGSWRKLLSTQ